MNYTGICIALLAAGSLSLAVMINKKKKQESNILKEANFEEIKTTVTKDVLRENLQEMSNIESKVDLLKKDLASQREKVLLLQTEDKNLQLDKVQCYGDAKQASDALGIQEAEKGSLSKQFENERAELSKNIASLTEEVGQKSKVCDYILKTSEDGKKLCGIPADAEPKEEAAAEPKKEEPKVGDTQKAAPEAPKRR